MTDQPSPTHNPAPGISRATAFRPDVTFRIALLVLVAAFSALTLRRVLDADPDGGPVATAVTLALLVAAAYAAARAWTTRVWVETSYPTGWVPGTSPDPGREASISELLAGAPASQTIFVLESAGLTGVRRREALLEPPTTLRLSGASFTGARPSWCLRVTGPDRGRRSVSTLSVRAPWLTDLRPLLLRLRYVVAQDERLAADADTLALVSGRRPLDEPR